MDNQQKIALITGATDGIGKALAFKLAKENYEVVIIGRNPDKVKATVNELKSENSNGLISGISGDLTIMSEVKIATAIFLQNHKQLDLLVLNANAISNERIITTEGNESNFAIGYLSRVLMIKKLESVLEATPKSQIISVIGLDTAPIDFDDITIKKDFTGRKGLTRWQWAINLFIQDYNKKNKVPINFYMPGLVKTKILKNEPQPMRLFVQIMNVIMGITPEKAVENMYQVIEQITCANKRNTTFSYAKERKPLKIKTQKGDTEKLLAVTESILGKY